LLELITSRSEIVNFKKTPRLFSENPPKIYFFELAKFNFLTHFPFFVVFKLGYAVTQMCYFYLTNNS